MLRMDWRHQWCGLADEALEDARYDRQALRVFAGSTAKEGEAGQVDLPRCVERPQWS